MALGDQAGLQAVQAIVAQLPGIEKFTDDERTQLIAGMAGLLTSGIAQLGSVVQANLAPAVKVGEDFNANLATLIGLLQEIRDNGVLITIPKSVAAVPADPETPKPGT